MRPDGLPGGDGSYAQPGGDPPRTSPTHRGQWAVPLGKRLNALLLSAAIEHEIVRGLRARWRPGVFNVQPRRR